MSGPGNAIFADATLTNSIVTFDQPGIYALRLTADDGLAATSADILIKVNTAPVVSAGADQTVTLGMPAVLAGSVSDDGIPGPTVATEWTQVSGPAGASFADSMVANTSVNFSQTGVYVFRLTANDGLTNSSAGVTITVVPAAPVNHPPVAPGQSLSATENTPLNITLTGTDVDGDALTFIVATQPAHGALSGTAPNLTYIPATDYTGSDSFTFKADDGRLASAPATVAINVTAASALQLNVPGDQEVLQDAPLIFADGRRITINGNKAGTEALILSLSVSNGTLTLDSMKGLTVTSGANGTGSLVVNGSRADLNAALDGMSYLGNPYFVGADTVAVEVEEPGASGSKDARVVPITVLPILTFINLLRGAVQNTPFVISYNDLYWNSDIGYEVSFKVESLTSGALTKNGEPLEYGTSLISQDESVIWTPPADAIGQVEAFRVVAWDGVHQSSNSVPVVVEVHAPMHLNVPGKQTIPHNMALVFGTGRLISITDEDPGLGELELSLSVSGGTLTLGRVDGLDWQAGANGTSAQIVRGSLADLNAALAGLTYLNTAGFSGTDLLNLAVDDLGNNDLGVNFKDAKTIPIAVLAPPNNPPKVSIVAPADTSLFQSGQTIAVEAAAVDSDGQIIKVTLFADGLELAELTGPPFAAAWTGAALGRHVLSAAATDDRGAAAFSSEVAIWVMDESGDFTVEAGPDQIVSLPNAAFLAGTVIIQTPVAEGVTNVTWSKLDGPGDVQFSDANALAATAQFSEPGSYVLRLQVAYAGNIRGDLIKVDVLPPPPNRLTAARSNRGSDFWLTFLSNVQPYFESPYIGQNLYVSASVDTAGTVTCFDGWALQEQRFQVRAGSSTTIPLCLNSGSFAVSDSIQDNAIHVTTDHPVALYGLNYEFCTTDGYLALPTTMLGTDYLVLAYRNSPGWQDPQYIAGGTQFAVVAAENDTSVTITPSASAGSRTAGVPYEIVLQQGETYRLINYDDPAADFTGTAIHSDNPVAVFGGHECALVPVGVGTADHLVEQLPPVNEWGRHFVTMPLATRAIGDTFRFLAATNGTRVVINGKIVASLDRGQYLERIIDGPAEILANKPILMAQYANGCTFDNDSGHGDPFMMLIPPFEQFGGDYILSTAQIISHQQDPPFEVYTDYLNLTVGANGAGTIILDDVPIPAADFQLIGNGGYAGAQLPLTPGAHHLSAPAPFGACVYGWAWCESYAFMGGFYSDTAEPDTKMELTQPTPFAAVGHEKTVFAHVTNGRGSPLPDMELTFSVSGANTATGHALTSRFGQAAFSYMGTNAGEDVITVSLAEFNQSVTNTWIAGSDNSPPVVSTTDTSPLQFSLTAQLAGTASDDGRPPGAPLRFGWRFLGGSGEVQIENTNLLSTRAFCSEPGTYLFELAADDSQFSSQSVASVTVVRPFTVTVGGVDPGSWFSTNASLQLCANIDMLDGVYTNVEFFDHDVKLSEGLSTSVTVDSPSPGEHSIIVVVTEEHGLQVRSEPLEFFVTFPPQIDVLLPDHDLTLPYDNPTATFQARAWEPDGTIANFAVYVGSGLVYQTNGDQIDFTGLVHDGIGVWFDTWPVHFIATDNHGISTDVFAANANLLPPTTSVNFVSPHNGDSFRLGQTVDFVIQASVTPPARVTDGQLAYYRTWGWWMWWSIEGWRWDNGSPTPVSHQSHWMPTETGDVDVRVKISTDACSWQESVVTIHILPAIGVSIASPTNSERWYVGTPSPIVLALDDPTGVFDHAEFFADGTSLGQTTNVWCEWTPSQIGNHTLTAKVYDHQGQTYNADAPVNIQAMPPPPPEVVITSPKNGDRLAVEQETLVAVDVNDPAQAVTNLELLVDGIKVTDSLDSYIPWTPASTGNHTLTVVAADWNGNRVTSAPVTLAVVEMHPPTVTIISPTDETHFTAETLPPLDAEASDPDGTVTNLTLELDGAVLGKTNSGVLELVVTNILGGWHTVQARATDNDWLTGTSASVSFFIERSVDASLPVPAQLAAEALSATEIRLNWQPLPTNTPAGSVLVERWNSDLSAWIEVGKVSIAETNYTDPSLNPETSYHYRVATTDNIVHRSACSMEAQATTRTVVPHYSVIDLTEALIGSLTSPSANILTNSGLHDFDSRRSASLGGGHAESALGTNATALKLAAARFKERWPQIQLDYDPVLLSPKSILPRLG